MWFKKTAFLDKTERFCYNKCITEKRGKDMREIKTGRVYRHFKGDYYLVEATGLYSETGEEVVIYRRLYEDGGLWVRPLKMFLEEVDREKYPDCTQKYRFELVEIESKARH